jgi:hypothetical protein
MKPSDSGKQVKIFEKMQFSKNLESSNESKLTKPGKINQYRD